MVRAAATQFKIQNYLGDLVLGIWWPLKLTITPDASRSLYNCVRKANLEGLEDNFEGHAASTSCVFVQLFLYIEETRQHDGSAPVFKRNYPIFTSHKWKS